VSLQLEFHSDFWLFRFKVPTALLNKQCDNYQSTEIFVIVNNIFSH